MKNIFCILTECHVDKLCSTYFTKRNFAFFFSQNNLIFNLDAKDTTMMGSLGKSPPYVVSSSSTQTGLEKLRSIFKLNPGSGDSLPTPKKTVQFQMPPNIKEMYSGDPELENYVLEQMQEEEQKREAHLAKVAQQKKAQATEITLQWINKLKEEKKKKKHEEAEHIHLQKEKAEAEWCSQEEAKQAEILKKKQLEDEICRKVLLEKKQKEDEAATKEADRLEKFEIENQIHAEQGMELLIIPPELLDKSVPSEIKSP